ncbi:MAG: hypothetical protein IH795_08610 [Bacteroidetes bacterium]|nr:hypothetical protein [Bacteroidota bacterium]
MSDIIQLNIDTPMIDPNTGRPVKLVTNAALLDLGIQSDMEMEKRIDEFPTSVLGNVITSLFDGTVIPSSSLFSIYNEIIIDIRKARKQGEFNIEITKHSLEQFRKIFADKPPQEPRNNRNVAFVLECIDFALAKLVTEPLKIPEN